MKYVVFLQHIYPPVALHFDLSHIEACKLAVTLSRCLLFLFQGETI